jgi:hypothetical protein
MSGWGTELFYAVVPPVASSMAWFDVSAKHIHMIWFYQCSSELIGGQYSCPLKRSLLDCLLSSAAIGALLNTTVLGTARPT